ncbi:hypothetical protein GCM10009798_14270 [Nocardioides panacihumi]|uniref:Uncharacterized protein n=1 Tax=Nocardioides panacihumi TaxID=400774 RepID=A0ABP5C282_9ACTN
MADAADERVVPDVREYRDDMSASLEDWWPRLSDATRGWLIANNGDAVPDSIAEEITRAGGVIVADAWWVGQIEPTGFYLSDEAVDWIEECANGETPGPRLG